MPTYLTMAPNVEITAEVDAPDSRHARTAYLDYLTRNGYVPYTVRQALRRVVTTKRVQPGEAMTTVRLSYGASPASPREVVAPTYLPPPEEEQVYVEAAPVEAPVQEPVDETGFTQSPIFKMSRNFGRL